MATILRIKRRRRDEHETLDALVIQEPHGGRPSKRVKDEASRPALDSTANKDHAILPTPSSVSSGGPGIFRFAETVETSTFTSEDSKRSLRERITSLLLHPPPASSGQRSATSSPRHSRFTSAEGSPSSSTTALQAAVNEAERKRARYRIIQQKRSTLFAPPASAQKQNTGRRPTAPPTIRTTAKASASSSLSGLTPLDSIDDFRILDAAIDDSEDSDDEIASRRRGVPQDPVLKKLNAYRQSRTDKLELHKRNQDRFQERSKPSSEDDDMMMNFVPMLQEYLSLSEKSAPAAPPSKTASSVLPHLQQDDSPTHPGYDSVPDLSSGDAGDSDSEWVYDVYYRDAGAATTSERTGMKGTAAGGDFIDVATGEGLRRIGALTGLQDDELLATDEVDGDDSDAVNTDDEDSNEEDFYRNDYPEGEGEDSDDMDDDESDEEQESDEDDYR